MSDRRMTTIKRTNRKLEEFSHVHWCCVQDMKHFISEWMENEDASDDTWMHRVYDLLRFRYWLIENRIETSEKPTERDFKAFINYLRDREIKTSSIRSIYIRIRAFFLWLYKNDLYQDITKGIKLEQAEYRERVALSAEEARFLIESQTNIKYKTMICLMVYCGLRCIEIAELMWCDIKNDRAVIRGKGRKEKNTIIVIPVTVQDCLSLWKRETTAGTNPGDYVFMSDYFRQKKPMTSISISKSVGLILKNTFPDKKGISAHCLRHTAITLAIESGMDVTRVSRFARHKSINTTMVYIHDNDRFTDPAEARIETMINKSNDSNLNGDDIGMALKRALLKLLKDD